VKRDIKLVLWTSMLATSIVIILTILSMYNIYYNKYFDNYHMFQISLFFTLVIWSLEILLNKKGNNYILYSIIFIIFANSIFIFMLWGVK